MNTGSFILLPTIDLMLELYQMPLGVERFQAYIKLLQGDSKGDLMLPVSGFNPMAKEHIPEKLNELKKLRAEELAKETLTELNSKISSETNKTFQVAINVADDLKGGWTNRYTSDYDSKFKLNALVERNFCTPIFWSSEIYTEELIKERVLEYAYRTLYWLKHPKPQTLKEHIEQESYVAKSAVSKSISPLKHFYETDAFYHAHQHSDQYALIFNFLYGDTASHSLEFPYYGIKEEMAGFKYAKEIS